MDDGRPADAVNSAVDLTAYDAVILDFDGPMCDVFAGRPANTVAQELRKLLTAKGWQAEELESIGDPHTILRFVHSRAPALATKIEAALAEAEVAAVETATETPGLAALLTMLEASQTPVAIASNNNAAAIRRWLARHHYAIEHVVGRNPCDPSKMKPAADVLINAISLLQVEPHRTAFVGDAVTDAEAAAAAGCWFVAFANKPHKPELFQNLGCTAMVRSLNELLAARNTPAPRPEQGQCLEAGERHE